MSNDYAAIQVGDIVHLNSGSPDLTVVRCCGEKLEVEWLNLSGVTERMTLPAVCFKHAKPR